MPSSENLRRSHYELGHYELGDDADICSPPRSPNSLAI
jgi:hypothetical protein